MSTRRHLSPVPKADGELPGLRITFEASSPRRAVAVAAELLHLTGALATVHPVLPLSTSEDPDGAPRTWTIDVSVPGLSIGPGINAMERKLLSLEYRLRGTRFLGWTTTAIPTIAERTAPAVAEPAPRDRRPPPSQRDLVAESLLRCPAPRRLDASAGSCEPVMLPLGRRAVRPRL